MIEENFPRFNIQDLPEYHQLKPDNPQDRVDALGLMMAFGRAVHWVAIFDIIWPDFEDIEYLKIEVGYIVINDPNDANLSPSFYEYVAKMIAMFWELQLKQKHPNWKWDIFIDDDPEVTLDITILSKS